MEYQREVRIYASRVKALLFAVFSMGMLVFAILLQFGYLHATSFTNPARLWIYQEPWKTIFALAAIFLCGPGLLFFGYWLFTTKPLLVIDDKGMSHRVPRYARSYMVSRVSWRHVESIDAWDEKGLKGELVLIITLKGREDEGIAHKEHEVWSFPHLLLPVHTGELIALIEMHCAIQMEGAHRSPQ